MLLLTTRAGQNNNNTVNKIGPRLISDKKHRGMGIQYTNNPKHVKHQNTKSERFYQLSKISKLKFHGICVYVKNHLKGLVIHVPYED